MAIRRALVVPFLAVAAVSQAALIDAFTDGACPITLRSGFDSDFTAASVLGGVRGAYLGVQANQFNEEVSWDRGNAKASPGVDAEFRLLYGYGLTAETNENDLTDLNLDLAAEDLVLTFEGNNQPLPVRAVSSLNHEIVATATKMLPASRGRQTIVFTAADFRGSVADVAQLVIEFDPLASGSFSLTRVETVPEPASLGVLGLGLAALKRRRKSA